MKIGIIGGGQLALMMIQESPEHSYIVLEPNSDCSVKNLTDIKIIKKPYDDIRSLQKLFNACDVITYEFENVPTKELEIIEDKLFPNSSILYISQNRFREKNLAKSLGIRTPKFFLIENIASLKKQLKTLGNKAILKSCEGGYDGKGQFIIKNQIITPEIEAFVQNTKTCILEEFISFNFETSVIASRDSFGNFCSLPSTTNFHKNGILKITNNFSNINCREIIEVTKRIMEHFNVIGTLTVEFFITANGFYFNELAPRPHNSGHWSIEGCNVSQFKNHILAITNQKIISPTIKEPAVMINLLGDDISKVKKLKEYSSKIYFHDYFKTQIKPMRKMGHLTIINPDIIECEATCRDIIKELKK